MSLPTSITAIIGGILGFAVVVALSLIVGGRFAMSDGFRLNDTFGGVFVVDRFTGATRFCSTNKGALSCVPVPDRPN